MRHPMVLAVVVAGVLSTQVAQAAAQTRQGSGQANTSGHFVTTKGTDLARLNQAAVRVLDRPGCGCFGPFGYSSFVPYPPIVYYPPIFYDLPVPGYDPFVPRFPLLPPAAPQAPLKAADNPPPAPRPPAAQRDELEQRAEMQKHLRAGNEAFANAEYGVALRRYEQAVAAAPLEPAGFFHQAQAQLAIGKHAGAMVSIQRGLRLHPKWPEAVFQPRALYRDRAGDYDQHLAQLADQVGKNLNDDSLMFLLGYQLWFDGKRDEAVTLFERAASLAFDTTFLDRFLKMPKAAAP